MHIELDGEWNDREIRAGIRAARPVPLWVVPLASIVVIAILVILESAGAISSNAAFGSAVGITFVVTLMLALVPRQTRKLIDIPSLTGPVTGLLTDEALFLNSRNSSTTAPWSQFRSMRSNESAAALVTVQRSSVLVLRNWFPDDEAWDLFTSSAPKLVNRQPDSAVAVIGANKGIPEAAGPPFSDEGLSFGGPFSPAEYRRVVARMSPVRRYARAIVVLGVILFALSLVSSPGGLSTATTPVGLLSVGLGLVVLYVLPAVSTRLGRRGVMGDGVAGAADATGLRLQYGSGQSEVGWSAFVSVVRTEHGLGLMLNDQSGVIIVRSWFDSEVDWERFVALVLHHVEVAGRR